MQTPIGGLPRCAVGRAGEWELTDLLAEGSLARVYRARPAAAGSDLPGSYAVKTLRPEWSGDGRAIELLRREAVVGRCVSHPHLISILAAEPDEPPHFLVMPLLPGVALADYLASDRGVDLPVALWIARQTAEALDALDTAGWMHGDIKPSNLFLSPDMHITLLDLGFARRRGETGSAVDRCVLGTCGYIAPETITSALRPDIRSDIYSLGVVLFELLSGRLPFGGDTLAELATQHLRTRAPDLGRLAPHLPAGVVRLVREMLSKEPLRRPQTPRELIERIATLEIASFDARR